MLGATANSSADALALKAKPHAFIASALRTLETEREGVAALAAAMSDGLGPRFVAAVDTIRATFPHVPEIGHDRIPMRDEIELEGDPGIRVTIPGGTPGDRATCWTVVHAAPLVHGSEPGLISVLDLPAGR